MEEADRGRSLEPTERSRDREGRSSSAAGCREGLSPSLEEDGLLPGPADRGRSEVDPAETGLPLLRLLPGLCPALAESGLEEVGRIPCSPEPKRRGGKEELRWVGTMYISSSKVEEKGGGEGHR